MGLCKNCCWYYNEDEFRNWCLHFDRRISPNGSCDNYEKKETPEDAHYSGGGGCYLTGACVDYLGKPDDCEELTALRNFRDGYMKKSAEGARLVEEYYEVAPKIVKAIEASPEKSKYYDYIYGKIKTCMALIAQGSLEETQKEYTDMVAYLKNKLL